MVVAVRRRRQALRGRDGELERRDAAVRSNRLLQQRTPRTSYRWDVIGLII
jgi:hypothetical protein